MSKVSKKLADQFSFDQFIQIVAVPPAPTVSWLISQRRDDNYPDNRFIVSFCAKQNVKYLLVLNFSNVETQRFFIYCHKRRRKQEILSCKKLEKTNAQLFQLFFKQKCRKSSFLDEERVVNTDWFFKIYYFDNRFLFPVCFQLLKWEILLLFFVTDDIKIRVIGFFRMLVGQKNQLEDVTLGSWEFSLTVYRLY